MYHILFVSTLISIIEWKIAKGVDNMSYIKDRIDKIMLIIMALLIIAIPATAAYYAGICHAIEDSHIYLDNRGVVIMELDGETYGHFVTDWRE